MKRTLMKKVIFIGMIALLSGCFGSAEFDAENMSTVKESTQNMKDSLSDEQFEDLEKAIKYFSVGGTVGLKSMMILASSKDEMEALVLRNLSLIDGLNAVEILEKYEVSLEQE
jgi:protein involved in sex pheromone biosynthesis